MTYKINPWANSLPQQVQENKNNIEWLRKNLPNYKGDYSNTQIYTYNDVVIYENANYVMKVKNKDIVGIVPTNTDYWQLLSKNGKDGETEPFASGQQVPNEYLIGNTSADNPLIRKSEIENKQDKLSSIQIDNINDVPNKQNQRDESLETSAKYIVNAINEVNAKPSKPLPYLSFDETDPTPWFKSYYGQNEVEFKGTLNELITMLKTKFQDKPFVRGTIALFYNQTSYLHGEFMWLRTSNQSADVENIKLDMYGSVWIPTTTRTIKSVNIFLVKNDSDDDTWNKIYGLIGIQSFGDTETQLFTGTTGEQIIKGQYPETKFPQENLDIFNNSTYFVLGYYGVGRGQYINKIKK